MKLGDVRRLGNESWGCGGNMTPEYYEVTNLDPDKPLDIDVAVSGTTVKSAKGETLTAPAVDSINTFTMPNGVVPKPVSTSIKGGKLALTAAPKSVTVISLEP